MRTSAGRQPGGDRPARHRAPRAALGIDTVAVFSDPDARRALRRRRPTRRCGCPAPRPPTRTCAVDLHHRRRPKRPAPTPSTPATGSCPRTPRSPRACAAAGLTFVGPSPDGDRGDGLQDRGQGADGSGGRAGAARRRGRPATPTSTRWSAEWACRCWSRPPSAAAAGACGWRETRPSWPTRSRRARREAAAAFGDGTVFVERYVDRPAPHRGADLRRHPRHRRAPLRAGVLDPAPLPEDHRGGPVAGGRADDLRASARRRGGRRRQGDRLRRRGHGRVRPGPGRASSTSSRSTPACRSSTR